MPVGVVEVDRPNAGRLRIPVGLGRRHGLDTVATQPEVCLLDVVDDDRHPLKRAAGGRILDQLDQLVPEVHPYDAHA